MPTGYTAKVASGETTDFPTFAMACARAFGALVMMREDPADAEIPEDLTEDSSIKYHREHLANYEQEKIRIELMTEYEIARQADMAFVDAYKRWEESLDHVRLENKRIKDMIDQVKLWTPPTEEHIGMKDFMLQQLDISLTDEKYYLDPPKKETPKAWKARKLADVKWQINYRNTEIKEEVERGKGRTEWVKALRKSIADYSASQETARQL